MSEVKNTDYAIDYLVSVLENVNGLRGFEADATKVEQKPESTLCSIFRRYLTSSEDSIEPVFLSADEDKYIYMYDGKCYTPVDVKNLKYVIMTAMERLEISNIYSVNSSKKIAENCALVLQCDTDFIFKPNRRYAIFDNCVMDLMDFSLKEHSIEFRSDLRFGFSYKANAESALWIEKLNETIPDKSMQDALQEFMGALLDCREFKIEYALFMIGPVGQNGKSLIINSILSMFDPSLISNHTADKLFKSEKKEYYIASCDGKVCNYIDDLDYKDFSGGDFKAFVSNDAMSARSPYGRPFKTKKLPKLICNANDMPPITDDSGGFERRIMPIQCPNLLTEDKKDVTLEKRMKEEPVQQAIFNWILEGYKRVVANNGKIQLSETMKSMRSDIMADVNSARRWVEERCYCPCEPKGDFDERWRSMVDIMREFQQFCKDYGYNSVSAKGVGRVLNRLGFKKKHTRTGSFYCIDIREDIKEAEEKMNEADDLPF